LQDGSSAAGPPYGVMTPNREETRGAAHGDARVVDQDRDAGVRPQHLFDTSEIRLVVQVGGDDLDTTTSILPKAKTETSTPEAGLLVPRLR
jgi:hypothetical protein